MFIRIAAVIEIHRCPISPSPLETGHNAVSAAGGNSVRIFTVRPVAKCLPAPRALQLVGGRR